MPAAPSISSGPEPLRLPIAHPVTVRIAGCPVMGVLHLPAGARSPCVVACHGMGASKDGDKYLLLARELPSSGLALVRFDFRGSGQSGGLYRDATIGSRITDVEAMLGHLARHPALDGRFGLLGSSLGGFVALWAAWRRGDGLPLVMWNAPATLANVTATRAPEPFGAGAALLEEIATGRHVEAPAGVRSVLVIQGEADDTVPPSHARALFERAAEPRELLMLPGADHRLTEPEHRRAAVEASRRWFLRHLVT